MDPHEYEVMFHAEERHWWYLGMEAITRTVLGRRYQPGGNLEILDAGCGTGAAAATYLAEYGRVTACDLSGLALQYCRARKLARLACASVAALPFASDSFDLVTSFDVLYERSVPDDLAALAELERVLKIGGQLLLRLPAYDWLRGRHDQVIQTARRYTRGGVVDLLKQSNLAVEHLSYANTFLFPAAALKRLAERLQPGQPPRSDLLLEAGPFAGILRRILACEAPLVAGPGLPFGLSVVALARKTRI